MLFVRSLVAAVTLLVASAPPVSAQSWPNRPVRVLVGFPPGQATDVLARMAAQRMSDTTGQQFFVENIDYSVTIGGPYPQISLTLEVTPRTWFSTFNGYQFYPDSGLFPQFPPGTYNGNPTNGSNVFNDSVANPFTLAQVGRTLIVSDPSTQIVYSFVITGFTSASTVTLNTTYAGVTTSSAPYQIVQQ